VRTHRRSLHSPPNNKESSPPLRVISAGHPVYFRRKGMPLIYGNLALPMKGKLLNCLPGVRWAPSDIPAPSTSNANDKGGKKPHRTYALFTSASRKLKAAEPNHGAVHRRKSTISISSIPDPELDARTLGQGQSSYFAKLPLELRRMVYGYVYGKEMVHLTMGAKRKFGHFVCEEGTEVGECGCKILVGGREGRRLEGECLSLLRVCRRM